MSDQRHLMVADEECGTYHETGRSSPVSRWVYGISAGLAVAAVATLVIFKSGAAAVASDQMRPQELFAKEHLVKSCPAGHFHQCPSEWKAPGNAGGYHCLHKLARQTSQKAYESSGGACRPAKEGPFPFDDCQDQCGIGATVPAHGSHHSVVHHFHHYQGHHGTWGHSSHGSHWGSSYHGSPYYHGSHWGSSYHGSPYYHDASTPALAGDEQYKEWKDSLSDDTPALAGDEQYKEWKDSLSDDTPALAGDEQYKQWKDSLSVDYPTTDSHTVIHHYVAPLHSAHYYGGHGYSYGGSGYHDGSYYDDLGHSHGYSYSSGDALPPGYDSTYGGSYGGSYSHGGSYGSHHFSGSYGHGSGSYHYRHHSYHSSKDENGIYSCAPHDNQCPADWKGKGNAGGYHCLHQLAKQTSRKAYLKSGGACRPAAQGPFQHSDCKVQCRIGGHARVLVDTKKEGLKIKDPSKKKGLKISEK